MSESIHIVPYLSTSSLRRNTEPKRLPHHVPSR